MDEVACLERWPRVRELSSAGHRRVIDGEDACCSAQPVEHVESSERRLPVGSPQAAVEKLLEHLDARRAFDGAAPNRAQRDPRRLPKRVCRPGRVDEDVRVDEDPAHGSASYLSRAYSSSIASHSSTSKTSSEQRASTAAIRAARS